MNFCCIYHHPRNPGFRILSNGTPTYLTIVLRDYSSKYSRGLVIVGAPPFLRNVGHHILQCSVVLSAEGTVRTYRNFRRAFMMNSQRHYDLVLAPSFLCFLPSQYLSTSLCPGIQNIWNIPIRHNRGTVEF